MRCMQLPPMVRDYLLLLLFTGLKTAGSKCTALDRD